MQFRQQALQELQQASKLNLQLDYEFMIYRYRRIIEDELAENQNSS